MQRAGFREMCAEKGLAVTHQRQVIWEVLCSMHGHPSPEAVYERVREKIPSISLATVYKNVHVFMEHGLLAEVSLHHGPARLETNMHPHHHMVCVRCRSIVDLPDEALEPVQLRAGSAGSFRIQRCVVEIHGVCARCAESPSLQS